MNSLLQAPLGVLPRQPIEHSAMTEHQIISISGLHACTRRRRRHISRKVSYLPVVAHVGSSLLLSCGMLII